MISTATINDWAGAWSAIMVRGLIDASALLLLVAAAWLASRRRMSAHLAYGLFLLVPLKLALPIPITLPREVAAFWPAAEAARGPAGGDSPASAEPISIHRDLGLPAAPDPAPAAFGPGPEFAAIPAPFGEAPIAPDVSAHAQPTTRPAAEGPELSRGAKLMLGWAAIAGALLLGLAWRHGRMERRVRRSGLLDPASLLVDFPALCRLSGLRRPVVLVSAPWTASPAVWGLFRPRLLLPPDLAGALGPDALRWVLLHELAHVRRRDGWAALLQRLVQVAYFFHPAAWLANRMIDVQREYACDDAALAASGAPRLACGDGFLTIVERANSSPAPRLPALGLLHSPALIRSRLMRILDARRPLHARLTIGAGALLLLSAIVALPRVQAGPGTPTAEPAPRRAITIRVIDKEKGGPLPRAAIKVRNFRLRPEMEQLTADAQGRCEVAIPGEIPESIAVSAHSDGFVPMRVHWDAAELLSGPPAEQTLALPRGEMIGGVVRDEQGRPISGAKVTAWIRTPASPGKEQADADSFPAETDAEGRWRAAYLPGGTPPDTEVLIRLEHPDFISEPAGFSRRSTAGEARELEHAEVMAAGVSVKGRVIGPDGKPVPGARVALDEAVHADPKSNILRATSDASGEFRIDHVQHFADRQGGHRELLSIEAPGLAPGVQSVEIGPAAPTIEVRLEAARPLRGRVVDAKGRPLAGAAVSVFTYKQCRSLGWRAETDEEGRFRWADGPASGVVELQAYKAPYVRAVQRAARAGEEAPEIVLHRPLRARGTVVDAQTGKPIPRFKLIPGSGPSSPASPYRWNRGRARQGTDGAFDEENLFFFDQPIGLALLVEADGYLPQTFDGFTAADESVEHAFRLRRAAPITGIVRDPEGKPLAGARVELVNGFDFGNRMELPPAIANKSAAETDAEGRYSIPPREQPYGIAVRHERGFAQIWASELAKAADITLRPWGRIEGIYRVGERPAAGDAITISVDGTSPAATNWVHHSYRAKTDAEGRFAIERVVPGIAVAFSPTVGPHSFEVLPEGTTRVAMGGSGRSVVGRIIAPEEIPLTPQILGGSLARLVIDQPDPPKPDGSAAANRAGHIARMIAWYATPEGRAWKLNYQGNPLRIAADGAFRAVDVPPGKYKLEIRLRDPEAFRRRDEARTEVSASAERKVVVPDGPADEPIDLGPLELKAASRHYGALAVGDKAPEIEGATTLDGEPLLLSSYRGKYVLLDFWATWCGPCIEEEPHLKAARAAYKDDDRLVMVSLSLDDDVKAPRMHAEARGLDWVQGFLGKSGGVAEKFGVAGIPQILLIGPDGKVLAKDLSGAGIGIAIARSLGKK